VLVVGGIGDGSRLPNGSLSENTGDVYDSDSNSWPSWAFLDDRSRASGAIALLPGGSVLIAGGRNDINMSIQFPVNVDVSASVSSFEVYTPGNPNSAVIGNMSEGRAGLTATTLTDGTVLLVGGADTPTSVVKSADVFAPVP
jgi:hypothetical protein